MKVEVTLVKRCAVGATGSLMLQPFMYFQIWQGNFNVIKGGFDLKCRSQAEEIFTAGQQQQHVSSCRPLKQHPGWVQSAVGGGATRHLLRWSYQLGFEGPEALLNISLSLDYSALLPLLLPHNKTTVSSVLNESVSSGVKLHGAPAEQKSIFWTTENCLFFKRNVFEWAQNRSKYCICLFLLWKMGHFFYWLTI